METAPPLIPSNPSQTIRLAHTAKCKLHIAANQPDRNLRFLLGHAFTLDKLRLRIAEIEMDSESDSDKEEQEQGEGEGGDRRVKFSGGNGARKANGAASPRRKSPPPPPVIVVSDDDEEDDDIATGDGDEEDEDLSLTRFESAAAKPPRVRGDDNEDKDIEQDQRSPPETMLHPSEEELRTITQGAGSEEWKGMYEKVAGCRCHGHKAPGAERVWELPRDLGGALGKEGRRLAVVEVAA